MATRRRTTTSGKVRKTRTDNSKTGGVTTTTSTKGAGTRTTYSHNSATGRQKKTTTTYVGGGYYERKSETLNPKPRKVKKTKSTPYRKPKRNYHNYDSSNIEFSLKEILYLLGNAAIGSVVGIGIGILLYLLMK